MNNTDIISTKKENLILRDHLAADRTLLANERTFLAYIRTSFTFIVAGITILKLFTTFSMGIVAFASILSGFLIIIWGIVRYRKTQMHIDLAYAEPTMIKSTTTTTVEMLQTNQLSA